MTATILVVYLSFLPSTKQIASNRPNIPDQDPEQKKTWQSHQQLFSSRKWKFLKSPLYCHSLENYFCGRKAVLYN
jgi:hypothetical protein